MTKTLPIIPKEIEQLIDKNISIANREAVPGFTIDGETSKDLDDALWLQPNPSGAVISVHISDVSAIIQPGSSLEAHALSQVETRYLATKNIPMFPHELSEDNLSLLEDKLRLTVTIRITLDDNANIKETSLHLTHLTSLKRFSYTSADAALHDPSSPFFQMLRYCELWAQKLAWKRQDVGAIGLSSVGGVNLDEEGRILTTPLYHSQQIIQEFMILANTAVASLAENHRLPILYRNHTASAIAPKSQELIETLTTLGLPELVRQKLQSWLNPATYSPAVIGHFALALSAYTHFTSPIRRVADYVNHRILKAVFIEGQDSPYTLDELEAIAKHINNKRTEVKEQRDEHFREKRLNETVNILRNKGKIENLSDKEFSQIIKDSLRVSKLDKIVPEAISRIGEGNIKPVDLYYLIFGDYNDLEVLDLLKNQILDYLEEKQVEATKIIQIAATTNQKTVEYIEKTTASGKFAFWSVLERETTAVPGIASNKQAAKHQANYLLIEGVLDQSLVPLRFIDEDSLQDINSKTHKIPIETTDESMSDLETEEIDMELVPSAAYQSPVGYLHETLQRLKMKRPDYYYHQVGNGWLCRCQIEWLDEPLIETEAIESSKKDAKTNASLKAIIHLEKFVVEELSD
ncbi:RNB domain-containing ribonuclease [Crocosphaera sp. Alani8]|uniref:RNB domain-containing ribonuclease n=1 Tax=Crocosphaera sp. Alani8 TaxID=3038952 RepID=UPI00313E95E8